MNIIIDFETRSHLNLKVVGADNYALHPTTDILCLAGAILTPDYRTDFVWLPGEDIPQLLITAVEVTEHVVAHNARFDKLIWDCIAVGKYNFPQLPDELWLCSAAQCRVNALPSSLANAARALNAKQRKAAEGAKLIKALSMPDKAGRFHEDPDKRVQDELMRQMVVYCVQDVNTTVDVFNATRPMTEIELADYHCNERINDKGVCVDLYLADLAIPYADAERDSITARLSALTQGAITKHTQAVRFREYLLDELGDRDDVRDIMRRKVKGKVKYSGDKATRAELMNLPDIPEAVREVAMLLDKGNKSSVSKFQRMIDLADEGDDRVRGCLLYAGAGQTKRHSARGLQLQNMIRDCFSAEETEKLIDAMEKGEPISDVMQTLAKLIRPAIVPEDGNVFVVGDWSAIEARVLPWLSDSSGGEAVLDVFRRGEDVYLHTADKMHADSRMVGKVATLALGFAGGVGALQAMAKVYGLVMSDRRAQGIVNRWRAANPWAGHFWKAIDRAVKRAVRGRGTHHKAGRVSYHFDKALMGGTLVCTLPSGETIQYPSTRLESVDHPTFGPQVALTYAKASLTPAADARAWPRETLWHGILVENITQAVAGEILRDALRGLNNVVLTVHDEIVLEVPEEDADKEKQNLTITMETPPTWAKTIPLEAKPVIMRRYGK